MKKITPFIFFGILFMNNLTAQTCKQLSFQRIIGSTGNDEAYDVIQTPDAGYLICGTTNSSGAGGQDALLIKTDNNGIVAWSKTYGSPGNDVFYRLIQTKDGNFAAIGWSQFTFSHVTDIYIVKFDAAGNIIWSKSYGAGTSFGERGLGITETDDGGFAIAADYNTEATVVQPLYLKIDANGNLLWSKLLNINSSGEAFQLVAQGNFLIGAGVVAASGISTFNNGYIVKLSSIDGSLLWTKNVESEGRSNRLGDIKLKNNELIFDMYNADSWISINEKPIIFKTDTSGNLLYTESYEVAGINTDQIFLSVYPTTDNGYIASLSETTNNSSPKLAKINSTGVVDWTHHFTTYYTQHLYRVIQDLSNKFIAVGNVNKTSGDNTHIFFMKTDVNGEITDTLAKPVCKLIHSAAVNNNVPVQINDFNFWSSITDGALQSIPSATVLTNFIGQVENPCTGATQCTTLKISGPDSLCNIQNIYSYKATRSIGCTIPVQWQINPNTVSVIAYTDSTVQLQFKQTTQVKLYGTLSGCNILQDSMIIHAFNNPGSAINLGIDTGFCLGSNKILNAGTGFSSYQWNTGETSQQIIVSQKGNYSVAAIDINKCVSKDTIAINVFNLPFVNIGPDAFVCRNGEHIFDAGNNFTSYLWQDNSTASTLITTQPGRYWVRVTDINQCANSDTARILGVKELPQNFLPPDTKICKGELLQLSATGNWVTYKWSNNSTDSTISITVPGKYSLTVTDVVGCSGTDSIAVFSKDCKLGVYFPNAFTPNRDGKNDMYRPIVYGTLDKFYMVVYNRYGEKIFETKDPLKGWDGSYKGAPQDTNTFVWSAVYHLLNSTEKEKDEKGTLVLIR